MSAFQFEMLPEEDDSAEGKNPPTLVRGDEVAESFDKYNRSVSVKPLSGDYGLVPRRVFNVLLAFAHAGLKARYPDYQARLAAIRSSVENREVLYHEATVTDLMRAAGWSHSHNTRAFYDAMRLLFTLRCEWDVRGAKPGVHDKVAEAPLLSYFDRTESGAVTWCWVPDLFWLLFDPSYGYTPIDLSLMRQFSSSYSLALFENAWRYRNMSSKATPWHTVEDWRVLLAGPGKYPKYGEFKRSVLKVAMEGLERLQTCPITVTLEERLGSRGVVEKLRFHLHFKDQPGLASMELPATGYDPLLEETLVSFGLPREKAARLQSLHSPEILREAVTATLRRSNAAGMEPVRDLGAYVLKVVNELVERDRIAFEQKKSAQLEQGATEALVGQIERDWEQLRQKEAAAWFEGLDGPAREQCVAEFDAAGGESWVVNTLQAEGLKKAVVRKRFLSWLIETRPEVLSSREAKNLVVFSSTRGARS